MKKIFYLTEDRLKAIEKEYEELRKARKEKTGGESPEVLHSEDLNPDYVAFKEKINFLDARISKLEEVIKNAEIIKPPKDKSKVSVGAKVTIEADGQEDEFFIVGSMEADPKNGKISDESLVGSNLIGKKEGDEVTLSSKVKTTYKIKKIEYGLL